MARVITYKELLRLLSQKIDEPAAEGTAGQRLTTNGAGERTWSGSGSIIAADRIRINGNEYFVRTGESGAAGYLTIGNNTLWLGTVPFLLDLGERGVKRIYKDTSLVYEKPSGVYTLFDNGWADNISWSGNLLNRPQYTSQGLYRLDTVESQGFMQLYVTTSPSYSDVRHNCHVCTTDHVSVPADATRLKVTFQALGTPSKVPYYRFGVLGDGYVDSMDPTGGQLTPLTGINSNLEQTVEMVLNAGIAGTNLYRVIVNYAISVKAEGSTAPGIKITKVWFE